MRDTTIPRWAFGFVGVVCFVILFCPSQLLVAKLLGLHEGWFSIGAVKALWASWDTLDSWQRVALNLGAFFVAALASSLLLAILVGSRGVGLGYVLGRDGPASRGDVSSLISALTAGDGVERGNAAWALGKLGPGAIQAGPQLIIALEDTVENVRANSAFAIGEMQLDGDTTVLALVRLLNDESQLVRGNAIVAMGQLGSTAIGALQDLRQIAEDGQEKESVRAAARRAVNAIRA